MAPRTLSAMGEKLEADRAAGTARGLGAAGAPACLLLHYLVFRRLLDAASVQAMERVRMQNGPVGRVLYGGIVREVLMRFGLVAAMIAHAMFRPVW